MTLLPIIYTSVLIFSVFILFIITISYISYKTKLRGRETRKFEYPSTFNQPILVRSAFNNGIVSQPIQLPNQTKYIEPKNLNIPQSKPIEKSIKQLTSYLEARTYESLYEKKSYNYNESLPYIEKNEKSQERKLKRYETQSLSNRLEVMNTVEGFRKTNELVNDQPIISHRNSSIDEINLLNYYSDNSDLDFMALSASRANRAV